MGNKATKAYWDKGYAYIEPRVAPKSDLIRAWIERHVPSVSGSENKTCIEIGCYPGTYLSVFGELGYELYGIDFCEQLQLLPKYLRERGYRVGDFWQEDFLKFIHPRKFDVVASFGFVEHFTNWAEILEKHISLLNREGYLIVEVPNFTGFFQQWFHANFDKSNYARHHVPAMDLKKWTDILDSRGLEIIYKGYFGRFDFWTEYEQGDLLEKLFLKSLILPRDFLKRVLPKDKKAYSPFGGIVAKKRDDSFSIESR